jgi:hypothetical protein
MKKSDRIMKSVFRLIEGWAEECVSWPMKRTLFFTALSDARAAARLAKTMREYRIVSCVVPDGSYGSYYLVKLIVYKNKCLFGGDSV